MKYLEKISFKRIPIWIVVLIVIFNLIITVQFGYLVTKSKTALEIAQIPNILSKIFKGNLNEFGKDIKRFGNKSGLYVYSKFEGDKYLLLARYDNAIKRSVVELIDVKKKEIINTWKPDIKSINKLSKLPRNRFDLEKNHDSRRYMIYHPWLNNDGSLIFSGGTNPWATPLVKIDKCSNIVWSVDYPFHHSIERDHEKNYWVPIFFHPQKVTAGFDEKYGSSIQYFMDDGIMKVSAHGKVLFQKSIMQIFIENDLGHLIFPGEDYTFDPIHLNDIQPVKTDGLYYKKGDVFLSLRNLSMIVLYRPSNNKILWYKKYPWRYQHDVDILDENRISVFNNNKVLFYPRIVGKQEDSPRTNNVLIYDFEKNKVFNNYEKIFKKFHIVSNTGGLSEIINNQIFIEETNYGRILFSDENGNLLFEYINRGKNNKIYPLNWSRILKKEDLEMTIDSLKETKCD